jgi:hypothetical protein
MTSATSLTIFSEREPFLSIWINITTAEAVFLQNKRFVIATTCQPAHRLPAFNAIKFLGFDDVLRTVTEGGVG